VSAPATDLAPGDAQIRINGVGKVFSRRGRSTEALRDVHLDIRHGEFISLLGPSGCGKSTLLRLIGGLVERDTGSITVDGTAPATARSEKLFGLVPQAPALLPWHSVAKNARLLTSVHRRGNGPSVLDDAQIDALLDTVGLAAFVHSLPHELSGGMQQRVSLVRAFALGAPILLMDEPFAALDEITRADMRYLLLDLWTRTGATIVFVTHSVSEAVILSDRVAVMAPRPGRIVSVEGIDLPRPRTPDMEDAPEFHEHVRRLRAELRSSHS
jgi:NitT/TauT family transport system ATP-binding protein